MADEPMHPNFADKSLWEIVPNVPVLDEHQLNDQGRLIHVDAARLQRIATNTNARFARTGDAVALIVGHTDDEPGSQERPVVGWAKDLRVGDFVGGKKAIYADFYYRKSKANVVGDFPRRSVELWLGKDEIDPIALLGGTTPERDLGVVLKYSRKAGRPVRVYRRLFPERLVSNQYRGNGHQPKRVPPRGQVRYELDDLDDGGADDLPPPADQTAGAANAEGEETAAFKSMLLKVLPEILPEVLAQMGVGGDEGGMGMGGPGDDLGLGGPGMDDGMMAGGDMGAGLPPGGPGEGMEDDPEMDARHDHEGEPVRFSDCAMGSGTNTFVPSDSDQGSDRMVSMSRRSAARPQPAPEAAEVARLSRKLSAYEAGHARLLDRLGQTEAAAAVAQLEYEGVDFGTPQEKQDEINLLARLSRIDAEDATGKSAHFATQVEKYRKRYKRSTAAEAAAEVPLPAYLRYGREPERAVAAAPAVAQQQQAVAAAEVVKLSRQMTRQLGRHVGFDEAKVEYQRQAQQAATGVTATR